MAATAELLGRSAQAGENSSISRRWFVRDASDETEAIATVAGAAAASIGGQVLRNIAVDEEILDGYRCTASYGAFQRKEPPQKGESQFNFEINTQPQRVYVARGTIRKYGSNMPQIDLIGEQLDGGPPQGVDIYMPVHSESETHYLDAALITSPYKQQIKKLVGKVNNAPWKGHSGGEVLLAAVSGSKRGADDWEVTFRWLVTENQSNLTVGGITVTEKKGWEHLWPVYRHGDDPGGQPYVTNLIIGVCVAPVFEQANMANLGIGV